MGTAIVPSMNRFLIVLAGGLILGSIVDVARAFDKDVAPMFEASCLVCHSDTALTPLDLSGLGFDLADRETLRTWERVFERVESDAMPPVGVPRSADAVTEKAMASLKDALVRASLDVRAGQRGPLRRLTRLEYGYTMQDLLLIDEEIGLELGQSLPAEADSGGFDTVAERQGISPLHIRSYLEVADRALDAAIALGPRPKTGRFEIKYADSNYMNFMHEAKILGGGITKKLDDAVVMYFDTGSTYLMHTESEGFQVPRTGRYRITMEAYRYPGDVGSVPWPKTNIDNQTVTLTLYRGRKQGSSAQLSDLVGTFDLTDDIPKTVEVETFLRPGQLLSPSVADLDLPAEAYKYFDPDKNIRDYKGKGIAIKSLTIDGPMLEAWPPESTRRLLTGVEFDDAGQIRLTKPPYEHVVDIVRRFGSLAFRRPLQSSEVERFASLALPLLVEERPFLEVVRVPLRALLSAPSFLYQTGDVGKLDDYALATRLSYFLWRSMPDAELFEMARVGRLSDPQVLGRQVGRMLNDAKSERFVKDFAGQAFRLYELKVTTPDPELYPEYDDRLGQAMGRETELFLNELIAENLSVSHLIDADFTFVNRRLAEHYRIPDIRGQTMRKVTLPADSPRGGLLTQASIHKITANGTTTSPIPRGNFVLANLLGKPSPPPPANVADLEPDTRGTTTIREQLTAHRQNPTCAGCHRTIDPPGFALESFDPIGGVRTNYRISGGAFGGFPLPAKSGPRVDASGVTPTGQAFAGIDEYKRLLLENELNQVARHMASQLMVFGTGTEIDFADRDELEHMVARLRDQGYPMRTMIREVVNSDLFRTR